MHQELNKRAEALCLSAEKLVKRIHRSALAPDVARLSYAFTQARSESIGEYFRDPALRRAYIGYYAPTYAIKIASVLQRMWEEGHGFAIPQEGLHVLDLGAGPLVGVLGSYLTFGEIKKATAVDLKVGPMRLGLDLLEQLSASVASRVAIRTASLLGPPSMWKPSEPADLIIIAHVLNELGDARRALDKRLQVILAAKQCLSENGRILIVEPATRVSTRALMALRDMIEEDGNFSIYAPCTGAAKCPLLQTEESWCHAEFAWSQPAMLSKIDREVGFRKQTLKYSYLFLGHNKQPQQEESDFLRIVSGPMFATGKVRRYGCGKNGLLTLVTSEQNKDKRLSLFSRGERIDKMHLGEHGITISDEAGGKAWQKTVDPGKRQKKRLRKN